MVNYRYLSRIPTTLTGLPSRQDSLIRNKINIHQTNELQSAHRGFSGLVAWEFVLYCDRRPILRAVFVLDFNKGGMDLAQI